jgi:POT family proton-dependent oligopeptide transporter
MAFGGNLPLFFLALALIIIGNGYFKPNISSFLGTFYDTDDARKDGAFTIFYMGVNIGAFLSTLTCGYVGERISWHYGFGLAGIGMGLGLLVFWLLGPKYFEGKGKVPENTKPMVSWIGNNNLIWLGTLVVIPVAALLLSFDEAMSTVLLITSLIIIIYLIVMGIRDKEKSGPRLIVIVILFFFHAIFWALFEQAGGSLTLFTDRFVNRQAFGSIIPASIFQSLNPFYIMVLAPVFSWMWIKLSKKKLEPPTPVKFVLGLLQLAFGYVVILVGIYFFRDANGLVPVIFIFLLYLFHTTGELSLSPVGLSMITKLSPDKIVGFTMGFWMLSIAVANKMAGKIGQLTASEGAEAASLTIENYSNTYLVWGVAVVGGFAIVLMLLVPKLRKWMHGIH